MTNFVVLLRPSLTAWESYGWKDEMAGYVARSEEINSA
jgi:hypothetical protein